MPDPTDTTTSSRHPLRVDRELAVHGAWYEFFPRSEGGFVPGAGSWDRLDAAAAAGFDVVYLPPIHPVGRAFRKGRDNTLDAGADDVGSPWAIGGAEGGHTAVHPDLGTLGDVEAFIARAGELGVEIALDYALQCSPDHPWVSEHPEWFAHRPDGTIRYAENPPKKYQDIYPIDFWPELESDRVALWQACREILEFWIARGIRVFRVDNPHTKPLAFWAWLIREVQDAHPEIVFLSEAFTDPTMMHSLAEVGFSSVVHVLHVADREVGADRLRARTGQQPSCAMVPAQPVAQHARHPGAAAAGCIPGGVRRAGGARRDARAELGGLLGIRAR